LPHGKKPQHSRRLKNASRQTRDQVLRQALLNIYRRSRAHFGRLDWWPGETPFEVMVGAILTQNTSWANVERAIDNLKKNQLLQPRRLRKVKLQKLEQLIRPSGYFRQKARRLKIFLEFFFAPPLNGSIANMKKIPAGRMRQMLLAVKGIGPETADSILLYALDKPVFVIDAYTRRIFSQLGLAPEKISYEDLRKFFEQNLPQSVSLFNDYHAQIVAIGKHFCKKRAKCQLCPLFDLRKCHAHDSRPL